ncbi:MAG: hypothetical protein ABW321_26970 [Polyangiales bacterium]
MALPGCGISLAEGDSTMSLRVCMVVATWAFGILGFLSLMPAAMSVMMFDAPGSERQWATRIAALSVLSFPLVCWVGPKLGWHFFDRGAIGWGLALAYSPLANIVLCIGALAYIDRVMGGRFSGH